jgi:hypothetical protein
VMEYFLRWYSVGLKPAFLLTRTMLIDFCAILLPLGLASSPLISGQDQFGGLFVRALRFARVFQLQRVMEEEEMYNIFGDVPQSRKRLLNVFLTVFTLIYVSAGLFYVRRVMHVARNAPGLYADLCHVQKADINVIFLHSIVSDIPGL